MNCAGILHVRTCRWCGEPLTLEGSRWVHLEGGQAYTMECPKCGWKGPQPGTPGQPLTYEQDKCPSCGSQGTLQDDHVATPGNPQPAA